MMNGSGYGSNMGWGMGYFSVLAIVLTLLAVVALVLWARHNGAITDDDAGPRRILQERFARGEIDDAEFAGRIKALR